MPETLRRGRPSTPLRPDDSAIARLGAELRAWRVERKWTLTTLSEQMGWSPQHCSEVERGLTVPSWECTQACDDALGAGGRLLELLPAALLEQTRRRQERDAARRRDAGHDAPLATAPEDDPVDPATRRSVLTTAAAGAATAALGATPGVTAAREVDPELVRHWARLLGILARHDAIYGAREVMDTVRREVGLIAEHRQAARGDLRGRLMQVEARWSQLMSWLASEVGDTAGRDAWGTRAGKLAAASGDSDMAGYVMMRMAHWATSPEDIARLADRAGATARSEGVRELCALTRARAYALAGDPGGLERELEGVGSAPVGVDLGGLPVTAGFLCSSVARCWEPLDPGRAVTGYERTLREWPVDRPRGRALHQARLAMACADAGDLDRAAAEGVKAVGVARRTRSVVTRRELRRLADHVQGCGTADARRLREELATL